jgi:hypothetical protein
MTLGHNLTMQRVDHGERSGHHVGELFVAMSPRIGEPDSQA